MEGKAVWAVSELQTDGAGREMDSLSISLDLESRRKEKKPELRVQGVKWEKAGSAQAVEQGWAQLCKQQSGLWGRQITLGSPQDFGGAVNETKPASLSVEEQNWRLLGGSREQGQSPALPAREGDPALS